MLKPGCEAACRACPHREWTLTESLKQKENFVLQALEGTQNLNLKPIRSLGDENRYGYRKKVFLHAQWDAREVSACEKNPNGKWRLGLMLRDEILGVEKCPIHSPFIQNVISEFIVQLQVGAEFPLKGVSISGEILTLVVGRALGESELKILSEINWKEMGLKAVFLNHHPQFGKRKFALKNFSLIWGSEFVKDPDSGLFYGPTSFQQQISELHSEVLLVVSDFFKLEKGQKVLDLYSGNGMSFSRWLKQGANVLGVELSNESIRAFQKSFPNEKAYRSIYPDIYQGKIKDRLKQIEIFLSEQCENSKNTCAYVNPPRTGLEPETLEWFCQRDDIQKLAYLSCSPGTLGRDLKKLTEVRYGVIETRTFDFFPNTRHVETLVLLQKSLAYRSKELQN